MAAIGNRDGLVRGVSLRRRRARMLEKGGERAGDVSVPAADEHGIDLGLAAWQAVQSDAALAPSPLHHDPRQQRDADPGADAGQNRIERAELEQAHADDAAKVLAVGEAVADPALDRVELAAATMVASAVMNFDEFVMVR